MIQRLASTPNEGPRAHQKAPGDTAQIILPLRADSLQNRISGIGWLYTSIVHDLRNPLGAVLTSAEMLMEIDPESTQGKRLATNIYRAACRMRELLADLGRASWGNESKTEMCKIHDVITAAVEAAEPAAEMQSIQILHDVPNDLEMSVERYGLERVFFNLITNAIEAMPHGGKIRIGAQKGGQIRANRRRGYRAGNSVWDSRPVVRAVRYRRQGPRPRTGASAIPPDSAQSRRRYVDRTCRRRSVRNVFASEWITVVLGCVNRSAHRRPSRGIRAD
jgi:hypothetical protein